MSPPRAMDGGLHVTTPGEPVQGRGVPLVRPEGNPCKVCGKPILAGYLYLVRGPCHVVCAPPSKLDLAKVAEAARQR